MYHTTTIVIPVVEHLFKQIAQWFPKIEPSNDQEEKCYQNILKVLYNGYKLDIVLYFYYL